MNQSFDIYGSCVCRNLFNIKEGEQYQIHSFVQRNNPLLIKQSGLDDEFTDEDADRLIKYLETIKAKGMLEILSHKFNIRMLKILINGDSLKQLESKKSDWIIIDTFYAYADNLLIISKKQKKWYIKTDATFSWLIKKVIEQNPKYSEYSSETVNASLNSMLYVEDLCNFLINNYNNRIIVINSKPAYKVKDNNIISTNYSGLTESYQLFIQIVEKINCHIIDLPGTLFSTDDNAVHYNKRCMQYLKKCVDQIIEGFYSNVDL